MDRLAADLKDEWSRAVEVPTSIGTPCTTISTSRWCFRAEVHGNMTILIEPADAQAPLMLKLKNLPNRSDWIRLGDDS